MHACSFCYQSFPISPAGFLTLKNTDSAYMSFLESSGFTFKADGSFNLAYSTKHELKEKILPLAPFFADKPWLAAIHSGMKEEKTSFHDLQLVCAHILNEETVHLIQNGTFVSHLQPIIHAQSGRLYGYESLLRAMDQEISPYRLFQTAVETNMQSVLDKKAREAAIKAKASHIPAGIKSFINFLPSTIYNPEYCLKHTFDIVKKYGVSPQDLVFEVVETEKIEDVVHLKKVLNVYRENGMKVALDDLGAGYATLDMLHELQPDYVKIDRHYISNCHSDTEKQAFVSNVIAIGKKLGIQVLGEGVETEEEFAFLREKGIDFIQGYLIGKPSAKPVIPMILAG